jgi:hypothetical protein
LVKDYSLSPTNVKRKNESLWLGDEEIGCSVRVGYVWPWVNLARNLTH